MPVAGPSAADRAKAHYGWAERYSDAGYTRKAAAHFGRALEFGGGEDGNHADSNMSVLKAAFWLVYGACYDTVIADKLFEMRMRVGVHFVAAVGDKRRSVSVTLQDLASKKHEWVEISVDEDDATKLTYGEMFRRFAIALDECASRNDIDAGNRAYLQTHLMGHVYKKHIDALEKRRPTKKREKEAQKIYGHLDAKPRKRALGSK